MVRRLANRIEKNVKPFLKFCLGVSIFLNLAGYPYMRYSRLPEQVRLSGEQSAIAYAENFIKREPDFLNYVFGEFGAHWGAKHYIKSHD